MKKYVSSLGLLLLSLCLVACGQAAKEVEDKTYPATLTVVFEDKTDTKEVMVEAGDSVMDVLEEHHKVDDEGGFITAIDAVRQDPSTNTYWLYTVNGEMAEKGAEEMQVAEGDEIRFYLESFE